MIGRHWKNLLIVAIGMFFGTNATAQDKNDIGLLLGGTIVAASSSVHTNSGLAFEATYAHRFIELPRLGLGFEVPFIAIPSQDVQAISALSPRSYASLFITPGIRIMLGRPSRVSSWVSIGGGYARFDESTTLIAGIRNPFNRGTNRGVLQYAAGADFKLPSRIPLPIALRGEIRSFLSGQPRLNVAMSGSEQLTVLIAGGFVLRF